MRRVFDTTFDYKSDKPASTMPDADRDSLLLRADHELLWSRDLPARKDLPSREFFKPEAPAVRRKGYLIFTDPSTEAMHWYGSDAITSSYASWLAPMNPRPKALVDAIAGLSKDEKAVT